LLPVNEALREHCSPQVLLRVKLPIALPVRRYETVRRQPHRAWAEVLSQSKPRAGGHVVMVLTRHGRGVLERIVRVDGLMEVADPSGSLPARADTERALATHDAQRVLPVRIAPETGLLHRDVTFRRDSLVRIDVDQRNAHLAMWREGIRPARKGMTDPPVRVGTKTRARLVVREVGIRRKGQPVALNVACPGCIAEATDPSSMSKLHLSRLRGAVGSADFGEAAAVLEPRRGQVDGAPEHIRSVLDGRGALGDGDSPDESGRDERQIEPIVPRDVQQGSIEKYGRLTLAGAAEIEQRLPAR